MSKYVDIDWDDRAARRKLGKLAGFVRGGSWSGPGGAEGAREMKAALRVVGVQALEDIRDRFREQSEYGSGWPELSDVTVILRPGGGKIHGPRDVQAKRRGLKKLRDSNLLYLSLEPDGPGNTLEVLPEMTAVRVGTRMKRAETHQEGGASRFEFDKIKRKTFRRNVSMTKSGRRRPARGRGRRNWKSNKNGSPWNSYYFLMWNALKKMSGRLFSVPARPFMVPEALKPARYAKTLLRRMERFLA